MKSFLKYITIVLIAGGLMQSCETTELDLRTSPNALASDQADPNLLLTSVQLAYATNQQTFSDISAELTRIDYMFGRNYFNNYPGSTLNGVWSRTYSSGGNGVGDGVSVGILTNLQNLEAIDEANPDLDYSFHIGVAKTLYAHSLMQLVDFIGEAAFSQAGNPGEFPAPILDDGSSVYDAAFALLGEAANLMASNPSTLGAADLFYDGDVAKWRKLIGTLQMKYHMMKGNTAQFNAIASNAANYISSEADDFFLKYGTSELQPDTRHPDYATDYTPSGANIYQSNWLMETMLDYNDPRIRYYFYRQVDATPGADADPNEETLACSLAGVPDHFLDTNASYFPTAYCSVPNGYWGRTHGNNEGTPPDNFTRTAVGVYPAGGRFDDNSFGTVGLGLGGGGAGIEPIIMASYVDFWIGYMGDDAAKATALQNGLTKSMATVQSFAALDANADKSFEPDAGRVANYVTTIVADFNAGDAETKANIFAEQYFITLYGGATEAWNYYRLTGYPNTLAPNWELQPGPFPLSLLYPQNEVVTNPNLTQKTSLETPVFWNTGGCPDCY